MSHTYLITLYELIDERLKDAGQQLDTELPDQPATRFQEGRRDILQECKQFLKDQYTCKLPRRIRNKYT